MDKRRECCGKPCIYAGFINTNPMIMPQFNCSHPDNDRGTFRAEENCLYRTVPAEKEYLSMPDTDDYDTPDEMVAAPAPAPVEEVLTNDMKFDHDKINPLLLELGVPNALEAVNKVLMFGAQKYEAHSWKTVANGRERYDAAMRRHRRARDQGEIYDPESGLPHLAHEAINALFILELALTQGEVA